VKDAVITAARLAPVLNLSQEELLEKLSSDSGFKYLARRIDPDVGAQVDALELTGITVISEDKRVYPKGALAPQLLGFVGGDDYSGIAGLELQYDTILSGVFRKSRRHRRHKGRRAGPVDHPHHRRADTVQGRTGARRRSS
jgi:cell division protein FtsI/penicillin-binding protein 2